MCLSTWLLRNITMVLKACTRKCSGACGCECGVEPSGGSLALTQRMPRPQVLDGGAG